MTDKKYNTVSQTETVDAQEDIENNSKKVINFQKKKLLILTLLMKATFSTSKRMGKKGVHDPLLVLNRLESEHITNLALFGLDRSDGDLTWKWRAGGELISECNDPARPPVKGCNKKYFHWKMRRIVENIYFRIFTFLLIILDISLVIVEVYIGCSWNPVSVIIRNIDLVLSIYFVVEVSHSTDGLLLPDFF